MTTNHIDHIVWEECDHIWEENIDSISDRDVECIFCHCPGEQASDGSVFWPAT